MAGRRFRLPVVPALLVVPLALVALAGRPSGSAAAAAGLHHAAVVVDTGDGTVRKFCLAFPEESISGADALRRVEADPVFASYGGKGEAVCALCGVGCPSGNCFCDRSKYWAYHRAGPGGAPYAFSRAGASSTTVRDGDVEGWRWGGGEAPPAATVGEVCDVPEPPARTASGGSSSSTTTTAASGGAGETSPTTTPSASAAPPGPPAGSAAPAVTVTTARSGGRSPTGAPLAEGPTATVAGTTADDAAAADADGGSETATTTPADAAAGGAGDVAAPVNRPTTPVASRRGTSGDGRGGSGSGVLGLVAFVAVLGGVLGWRARLRRRDVRPMTTVR